MDARATLFQQNLDLMTNYVETQSEEVLNLLLETATQNFEIFLIISMRTTTISLIIYLIFLAPRK